MDTETIKQFLVGLGFGVDKDSLADFNKAIASASLKVTALAATISAAATGIFYSFTKISQGFEDMGYELRLVAPAVNRFLVMREAMLTAYKKAGINLTQVVQQSIQFNYSLAKTKFAFEALYKGVAARFFPILTKQMDIFREKIFANMPKIQKTLEKFIQFVFKAFTAVLELGHRLWSILTRVWSFFSELHEATNGWSTAILAALAAWKLFNLEFLATPLGLVIAGFTALLALFDDFKVWQEGGKSLFDWGPFVPVIKTVTDVFKNLHDVIADTFNVLFSFVKLIGDLVTFDFSHLKIDAENAFTDIKNQFSGVANTLGAIGNASSATFGWLQSAGNWIGQHTGIDNAINSMTGNGNPPPLTSQTSNKTMAIHQETNINVNGAADANSVGHAVSSSQQGVNRDLVRYGQGAFLR